MKEELTAANQRANAYKGTAKALEATNEAYKKEATAMREALKKATGHSFSPINFIAGGVCGAIAIIVAIANQ